MSAETVYLGRQRLAWGVLIGSFFVCALLTIAVPITASALIRGATRDLLISVQANEGTVGIDDPTGVRRAVIAGEEPQAVAAGSSILTDATATALLFLNEPLAETLLARLTVDGNSTVRLTQATMPRFGWTSEEVVADYELESGRLRLNLLESSGDPLIVHFETPQGTVTMSEPGQYAVEVNNQATQVSVQEGRASVVGSDSTLVLEALQRAEIPTGGIPQGPLDPERDLIQNGDFSQSFDKWAEYAWKAELADQPKGKTQVTRVDGEPVLRFERGGIGHADARVLQSINQTVADYDSLRLLLTLRIMEQSLGVCGIQGSECPLFVRINYIDENGVSQTWQQGFFASGEIDDNTTPGACVSCAVIQSNHERVPLSQDYFFDIDLGAELARQGAAAPRQIESLSLVASGHSFITDVIDVALIAR
jgi:hypothetical protein